MTASYTCQRKQAAGCALHERVALAPQRAGIGGVSVKNRSFSGTRISTAMGGGGFRARML
jgi:hypothetical protein